jgi:hypothetical protein
VYRFEETSARRSSTDCSTFWEPKEAPAEDAEPTPESLDLEVNGAVARRVDRPGQLEIVGLPALENAGFYDNGVSLAASAGRHLFVETWSDEMYCGAAHGFRTHAIRSFDLERGEFRDLLEPEGLAELRREEIQRHRQALLGCTTAYAKPMGPEIQPEDLLDDLNIAAILPRWNATDGFHLELGWALSVAYAAGTEEWGSYSSGCPATLAPVNEAVALEPPPRALDELMKLYPKATVGGWSHLTSTSETAIDTIDGAFERPADES